MINAEDIKTAIENVVIASGLFPRVAWANFDFVSDRPYLALIIVPMTVSDDTMNLTQPVWEGFILATAVTVAGQFETIGGLMLNQFGALFPPATRLTMTGGKIVIVSHPQPLPPYRDGQDYRQPIRISVRTET